jgi:acetyltransferase-like isoleucine patch superfamily enzyme
MQLITKPITIKKNAFLGVRSMILPNIVIGENSVVGAQAVVTKNVPANEIFAGNPAHKIGERKISHELN